MLVASIKTNIGKFFLTQELPPFIWQPKIHSIVKDWRPNLSLVATHMATEQGFGHHPMTRPSWMAIETHY
jgi:hypothetical protein